MEAFFIIRLQGTSFIAVKFFMQTLREKAVNDLTEIIENFIGANDQRSEDMIVDIGKIKSQPAHNHLINEKSPYLIQHAYNPVDWYPWCEEAFEKALRENKPIFLSIGYSSCHWCHVMEKESFEDPLIAEMMNNSFISIKVDREERPDIDNIYMTVCQLISGSGGWPLNIIMTQDMKPFFAATFIPKESRFGKMGLIDLIPRVNDVWVNRHYEVIESASGITEALLQVDNDRQSGSINDNSMELAYRQLHRHFDKTNGGFGRAPKFPTPHNLSFLLRYYEKTGDDEALVMAEKTLQQMGNGGIFDHIGFGFHRYSTDSQWLVPHFEKMLYDQAQIANAYIEAFQLTRNAEYEKTTREIFDYVGRELRDEKGGFYCSEDADSDGIEGKYYQWDENEIRSILGDDADLFIRVFNISADGNFIHQPSGKRIGKNILYRTSSIDDLVRSLSITKSDIESKIETCRQKLFAVRNMRSRPFKDDKILVDWNGLMIAALSKASQVFDDSHFAEMAKAAADFVLDNMQTPQGRLLHRYRDDQAAVTGNLNDCAFFVWGLMELYEATFDIKYLKEAIRLNDDMISHFWDSQNGGFFFLPDDGEKLLVRQKQFIDGAEPSGNSVALMNLIHLARITGKADYYAIIARLFDLFAGQIEKSPTAFTQFLCAVNYEFGPSAEVLIVGDSADKDTREILRTIRKSYFPNMIMLLRSPNGNLAEFDSIVDFAKDMVMINNKPTLYLCRNRTCELPTNDVNEVILILKENK